MPVRWVGVVLALCACRDPAFRRVPGWVLHEPDFRETVCTNANRLVIGTVRDAVSSATADEQRLNGMAPITTLLTLEVEREIARGRPAVPELRLRIPGGQIGTTRLQVTHTPTMELGTRWALALRYRSDAPAEDPLLLRASKIDPDRELPSQEAIDAAAARYCR